MVTVKGPKECEKKGKCCRVERSLIEKKREVQICRCCRDQQSASRMMQAFAQKVKLTEPPNRRGCSLRHMSGWQGYLSFLRQTKEVEPSAEITRPCMERVKVSKSSILTRKSKLYIKKK